MGTIQERDGGGSNAFASWWKNTIDRRYWSLHFFGPVFAGWPQQFVSVVDDFGSLVAVQR